jgi:hypothetical protein
VEDLAAILAAASGAGYSIRGPVRLDVAPYNGRQVAALNGPDGELIELVG